MSTSICSSFPGIPVLGRLLEYPPDRVLTKLTVFALEVSGVTSPANALFYAHGCNGPS